MNKVKFRKFLATGLVASLIIGCQKTSDPGFPSSATPVAQETIVAQDEAFVAVTSSYQESIGSGENGFLDLESWLDGKLPPGLGDDLTQLAVQTPAQQKVFDSTVLPQLKIAFSKPCFQAPGPLLVRDKPINFRGLRHLVSLLGQRADQHWQAGRKKEALELIALPLQLAQASSKRPETASANLFTSGYASTSLDLLASWFESGKMDAKTANEISVLLRTNAPSYAHLQETVSVDFAQLSNSLVDEKVRELLGIGQLEPRTLNKWLGQLTEIHGYAKSLYQLKIEKSTAFQDAVSKAATPIQGLVIDYPEISTMQKHAYSKYYGLQLGLAQMSFLRGWTKQGGEQILQDWLADEAETHQAVSALLKLEGDASSVKVVAQPGQFDLIAPQSPPVFFEMKK